MRIDGGKRRPVRVGCGIGDVVARLRQPAAVAGIAARVARMRCSTRSSRPLRAAS